MDRVASLISLSEMTSGYQYQRIACGYSVAPQVEMSQVAVVAARVARLEAAGVLSVLPSEQLQKLASDNEE